MSLPVTASARSSTNQQCTKIILNGGKVIYSVPRSLNIDGDGRVHTLIKDRSCSQFLTTCNQAIMKIINDFPERVRRERYGFMRMTEHQVAAFHGGYGVVELVHPHAGRRLEGRFHPYLNPHTKRGGFDTGEYAIDLRAWGRVQALVSCTLENDRYKQGA